MTRISIPGKALYLLILVAVLLCAPSVLAKTTVSFNSAYISPGDINLSDVTSQWQDKSDLNGPNVINSLAMSNLLGYPIGKAHLGKFPSFEVGVALGAGFSNMEYFDKNAPEHDNGSLPAVTPNAIAHFGVGLTDRVDVLGKFFTMSKSIADPGVESKLVTIRDYRMISAGGRLRYNLVKKKTLIPIFFNFGGVTVSGGADFLYGDFRVLGDYDTDFNNVEVDYGSGPTPIPLHFEGDYNTRVLWSLITLSTQAVAYFDILYFFSLYSGFGLSGNIGYFKFEFDGTGDVTTSSNPYFLATGTNSVGSMLFESKNNYPPYYIIPTYIIGLEVNLWVLKLTGETMVNLYNLSDVNAQVGLRIQI